MMMMMKVLMVVFMVGVVNCISNPTRHDLSSKDAFLKLLDSKSKFVIFGTTSFLGNPGADGNPRLDTFNDAKANQKAGTGRGDIIKVLMMEPAHPTKTKFPLIKVAIQPKSQGETSKYELLTNPSLVGNKATQPMVYLPAYADSIICTELPNYHTHHLLPKTVPKDLVLTDLLSGCSVFTIRLDPKPSKVNRVYRHEYFCHMNALNSQCGNARYSNDKIEESIKAARLVENPEDFNDPEVFLKVQGQGVDYENGDIVLVAAYNTGILNKNGQWRLKYEITRNLIKIGVWEKTTKT